MNQSTVKRAVDVTLSLLMGVVALPVIALSVLLVKLTSSGPAIYRQVRLGRGRKAFWIYKVRTMHQDCERTTGPRWSTKNDPRVTSVGRVLRKTHLDELPQLWNVLRGEMSLVGPRPERPEIVSQLEKALPHYGRRLEALPGLTGLAQVNLPPDESHECVRRKLVFDLHYVENQGPWMDLRVLVATASMLLGLAPAASRLLGLRPPGATDDEAEGTSLAPVEPIMSHQVVPAWPDS